MVSKSLLPGGCYMNAPDGLDITKSALFDNPDYLGLSRGFGPRASASPSGVLRLFRLRFMLPATLDRPLRVVLITGTSEARHGYHTHAGVSPG